jgi:hypothetical protein
LGGWGGGGAGGGGGGGPFSINHLVGTEMRTWQLLNSSCIRRYDGGEVMFG